MESQRTFLFIALLFVSYLLYIEWQKDYHPQPVIGQQPAGQTRSPTQDGAVPTASGTDVPVISASGEQSSAARLTKQTEQLVLIKTDVLELAINPRGGDIVAGDLLQFPIEQGEPAPVALLSQQHQAQSGLTGRDGPDANSQGRPLYHAERREYHISGSDVVEIPLTWVNPEGLKITKTFTIKANAYDIGVSYTISNSSSGIKTVRRYAQLKKIILAPESSMMMNAYNAATYSTAEERYEKYDLDDMQEHNLSKPTLGGWIAMQQHYFVAAWIPVAGQQNKIYSQVASDGSAIIGVMGPQLDIQPGQTETIDSTLYVGPKIQKELKKLSETLELTVDYGPLWFISQLLFWLLTKLYALVANWGVAIILITVIVKSALYWLTKKQTVSMARMRNLQPKLQQLKERHGDDRQNMGQSMMELYKKEGVNPMSGCLPLLLQMPIFLALYWMLMESVELRHAEFILWITDLSAKDPYFVLPVLYGASMFLMQKLQPTPTTDPMQQKVMTWMPVFFSVLFVIFPAGLVLYWFVNNVISILQTLYIYRGMEKSGLITKAAD